MAIGDQQDIFNRLISVLPPWFGDSTPVRDAILNAYAVTAAYNYQLYEYVKLQTRIKTATEDNLDLISQDYFGNKLPRRYGESDDTFRARILANLLPFPATRQGIATAVYTLTGRWPVITESFNISDNGALNINAYYNQSVYGSASYPATFWITAYRPISTGVGFPALNNDFYLNINGYFWSPDMIGRQVTDNDIYNLIAATKAAGVTALVEILD